MQEKSQSGPQRRGIGTAVGLLVKLTVMAVCIWLMSSSLAMEPIDWGYWPAMQYETHEMTVKGMKIEPSVTCVQFTEEGEMIYSFPVTYERMEKYLVDDGWIWEMVPGENTDTYVEFDLPTADGQYKEFWAPTESEIIHACLKAPQQSTYAWDFYDGATVVMLAKPLGGMNALIILRATAALASHTPLNLDQARFVAMLIVSAMNVWIVLTLLVSWLESSRARRSDGR